MDVSQRINRNLTALKPNDILAFNLEVGAIPGILRLTLGEPDFTTPEHVKAAGMHAIAANQSHYTPPRGLPSLRAAAAEFFANKYGVHYNPDTEVLVTVGATEAIFSSLMTVLNPGDTVILPSPAFPLYESVIRVCGASPIAINTEPDGFILRPERLEQALEENRDTVKAVVLNYPTNPTGVTYTRADLEALAAVLQKYAVFVISDEIYSELTYTGTHVSMGEVLREQTVLISGVSKSHAMTGWRIGIMCGPEAIISEIAKVHEYAVTAATTPAQVAAEEAFRSGADDAAPMKAEYVRRRDYFVPELEKMGFSVANPDGAFYLFAKIPEKFGTDSWNFCRRLAHEAKVAIVPGASFGPGGEGYVRISYAAAMEDLVEAVARMKPFVAAE
ncbi:aminotransferase class I/II-fold pyridoxal phosphate-dependent enzyme [Neoactinobaculum massilliense]|uniref:aminotransferase class I/II-fold pyridoxal phosphate-dependent enzyme n=1 Tax=Neoactinobaculum massilliense TaxID=2364794 RepID=UPI000F52F3F8|nr:aminotransferase class I/II-fold pyridoxal phosphate-dependent enzyme [Neoactinobaculum massilliense]